MTELHRKRELKGCSYIQGEVNCPLSVLSGRKPTERCLANSWLPYWLQTGCSFLIFPFISWNVLHYIFICIWLQAIHNLFMLHNSILVLRCYRFSSIVRTHPRLLKQGLRGEKIKLIANIYHMQWREWRRVLLRSICDVTEKQILPSFMGESQL